MEVIKRVDLPTEPGYENWEHTFECRKCTSILKITRKDFLLVPCGPKINGKTLRDGYNIVVCPVCKETTKRFTKSKPGKLPIEIIVEDTTKEKLNKVSFWVKLFGKD